MFLIVGTSRAVSKTHNFFLVVVFAVPFGKIPLGSMWKAAATLIVEQGAEKLGVFECFNDVWQQVQSTQ